MLANFNVLFFSFFWFTKVSQVHGLYGFMLFSTKYECNLIIHGSSFLLPSDYNGGWGGGGGTDLIWRFAKILWWQNCFLHLGQDKPLWVDLKINWGVIFITILLHFHFFISLETATSQKSEVFLLRISLGNVNASVVTCRYPQIYNFSFRKEFLETLCKCIYLGF